MKLQKPVYVNDKQRKELIKELNLTLNIFHVCSCLVIRKDNIEYVLKDRWRNPYESDIINLDILCEKDFLIISKNLLSRINDYCRNGEVIYPGDNIIVQM